MHQGEERHVAMKEKLPVHIVYFTAWPDGAGGVQTFPTSTATTPSRAAARPHVAASVKLGRVGWLTGDRAVTLEVCSPARAWSPACSSCRWPRSVGRQPIGRIRVAHAHRRRR